MRVVVRMSYDYQYEEGQGVKTISTRKGRGEDNKCERQQVLDCRNKDSFGRARRPHNTKRSMALIYIYICMYAYAYAYAYVHIYV